MEAKLNRLPICVLNENDLERSDEYIRAKIHRERQDWRRLASSGDSHGFLISVVSHRIATARPDVALQRLAATLCQLYLGVGDADAIFHDSLLLKTTDEQGLHWRQWKVGVNYFSSQADGRWWRDHRIPGGMAFSMNSVGHMARTQVERKSLGTASQNLGVARQKLVYWALRKAMETISPPVAENRRGTWLVDRGTFAEDKEPPPFEERVKLFGQLARFSENRYHGLYHTDHTLPSYYFNEGLWRREDLPVRDDLYFTYLHSLTDEAYESMGIGLALIAEEPETPLTDGMNRSTE